MSLPPKPPPQDLDAELAVLGSWFLLGDEPKRIRAARVEPGDFYLETNQRVAEALLGLLDDGIPIEPATVVHRLRRGRHAEDGERLAAVVAAAGEAVRSPSHVDHFADRVRNAAALRRLLDATTEAQSALYAPSADASEVLSTFEQAVSAARQSRPTALEGRASDMLGEAMGEILQVRSNDGKDPRMSWGFGALDRAGVFVRPGAFPVVAARPGCGKTTFLRRWAFRTANMTGRPVLYLTLEQDPVELVYDELLAEAGVRDPLGAGLGDGDARALQSAAAYLEGVEVYIPGTFPRRLGAMVTWLHQVIASHRPAAVVVDYLTLVEAPGTSAYERASLVSARLRGVARTTGCPVVCAAQLNRASAGDNREPELHDLRDSGQIEQDATSVILLHYPWAQATKDRRASHDVTEGDLTLLVKKNRRGRSFISLKLTFDGAMKRMLAREYEQATV